ncbi:MAG: class I SAM-dependent methyltransferase [Eubacterium sp.]
MDILDIGCGNGLLWVKEKEILPENINIYLVDNSRAMINAARKLILNEKDYYEKKKQLLDL